MLASEIRRSAWRAIIIGLLVVLAGGIATLATYADAQQQAAQTGHGTYYVAWGAIVFGLWRITRGVYVLIKLRRL